MLYKLTLAFIVGIIVGQITTAVIINPFNLVAEARQLGRLSFKYGCEAGNGKQCEYKSNQYDNSCLKNIIGY